MALSHYVRAFLTLKFITKEVIGNLGIDSENMKFVSSYTFQKGNNESIVVVTSPRMNTTPKHISVKYHWFRQHIGNEFVIQKIESEIQKADILTKVLQGDCFYSIRKFLCGCQGFRQEGLYREMTSSALNGDIMARKGTFWTVG